MLTVSVGFWAIYLAAGSLGLSHTTPRTLVDIQAVRRTLFLVVGVGAAWRSCSDSPWHTPSGDRFASSCGE